MAIKAVLATKKLGEHLRRDAQHMRVTGARLLGAGPASQPAKGQMALQLHSSSTVAPELNEMLEGRQLHVVLCVAPPRHVNRPPPRLYAPIHSPRFHQRRERQKSGDGRVAALVERGGD